MTEENTWTFKQYCSSSNSFKNKDVEFELNETGLYKDTIYKDGSNNRMPLAYFRYFRILVEISADHNKKYYDFEFNSEIYKNQTFDEILEYLKKYLRERKYIGYLSALLKDYIHENKSIIKLDYEYMCGFTKKGWIFPNLHRIQFSTAIHKKIEENLIEMLDLKINHEIVENKMRNLWSAITLENKDKIFALLLVSPFFSAMREFTDLMPYGALGFEPGTGKTKFMEIFVNYFWNHITTVINADIMNSQSRSGNYLSSCTLPIFIDDAQNLNDKNKDTIKTYLTSYSNFERLDKDQSFKVSRDLCASVFFTLNEEPDMFEDPAFITRGILYLINKINKNFDKIKFISVIKTIVKGEFGKHFYEKTIDWNLEKLRTIYDKIKDSTQFDEIRPNTIYKLHYFGQFLAKYLYNIDLDLTDLEQDIINTRENTNRDIYSILDTILEDGLRNKELYNSIDGVIEYIFKPENKWITSPVDVHIYKKTKGFLINVTNLEDINRRLKKKLKLTELARIIKKRYPDSYGVLNNQKIKHKGKVIYAIFIPK